MKRAIFDGSNRLSIVEVDKPVPEQDQVLVRVDAATICGTDVHILEGNQPAQPGTCLGHEFAGTVEAVGPGVSACRPGDLVTVEPHIYCGICKPCRTGKEHLCHNKLAFGVNMHGGFQQYALVPQKNCYVLPAGVAAEEAALCEAIGCCLHGIQRVGVDPGDTVLIFGGGFIGMVLLKLCRLRGAGRVFVSEPVAARRAMLTQMGADAVIDPAGEDLPARIAQLTDGLGPDVVIECAGRADTARLSVDIAARCGRVLFFGIVPPGQTIPVEPNIIFKRELTICGSAINPNTHHRVVELLPRLGCAELVTARHPLEQINQAMDAAKANTGLKICITPNG